MACLICERPAVIHHVISNGHCRITRTDRLITPLCVEHHDQRFPYSIHNLGPREFSVIHGIDLYHWACAEWDKSQKIEREAKDPPHWKVYA